MARLLRIQFPGAVYHVTVRGNERRLIFRDDADRRRFFDRLSQSQQVYSVRLYLACLMPNHFHLLLETPGGNLNRFMARLLTAYTVYYNLRHHRVGHLTQGRYKAQIVEGNQYLLKLSRYIHLNPVCGRHWKEASMEERRESLRAYGWSTFRSYARLEPDWKFIDYGPLRCLVEEGLRTEYGAYVEAGLSQDSEEFAKVYRQARLSMGSEPFTARVKEIHQEAIGGAARPEDAALRRRCGVQSGEETLAAVAQVLGVGVEALKVRRRASVARGVAAWALVKYAGMTQRAAAKELGLSTGAGISQQLKKWQSGLIENPSWQNILAELDGKLARAKY